LEEIKEKQGKKIPLDKLSFLLLTNEDQIRHKISEFCEFLSKMNIHRTEKTILALLLAMSFPGVFKISISRLIGVTPATIKNNLELLEDISFQKKNSLKRMHPFKHLGRLLEERMTDVPCFNCGNFIHVQLYQDDKKIFVCKQCLKRE